MPRPHDRLCPSDTASTTCSTSTWVEQLCWSSDGRSLAAGAGRTAVVAAIEAQQDREDTNTENLSAEVVRGVENNKQFGTISDIACINVNSRLRKERASGATTLPAADSCGDFAVGGYGGVGWLRHHGQGDQQPLGPELEIGATATLAVAISPDNSFVAVGCLDKRMRIFELLDQQDSARTAPAWDWVGFDGPVASVTWSASGKWLAAAGGTALLVVPKERLLPGSVTGDSLEPPIRCTVPGGMARAGITSKFGEIAWCPRKVTAASMCSRTNSDYQTAECYESLLAAIECPTGKVFLYSVATDCLDGGVPRRAAPLLSLDPPGTCAGAPRSCYSIGHVAMLADVCGDDLESDQRQESVVLVASHSDWSMAVKVELPNWHLQC